MKRLDVGRNEAMFRASDEVHERKADGDRAGELSREVEVAKAALDQVTRQLERDRARDNRPVVVLTTGAMPSTQSIAAAEHFRDIYPDLLTRLDNSNDPSPRI